MIGSRRTLGESTSQTPILASPVNLLNTNSTETTLAWSWNAGDVSNTEGYRIYINTINDFSTAAFQGIVGGNTYQFSGLTSSTTYYVFIVAIGSGFEDSSPSVDSATTQAGVGGLVPPIINSTTVEGTHRVIFDLSFDNSGGTIETLEVTRTSSNGTHVLNIPVAEATTYSIGGLSPTVEYTWNFVAKAIGSSNSTASTHIETMGAAPVKDTIPTTTYSRYGFVNTLTSYTGNWARVKRDSDDAIATIGFLANGSVDLEALEAHCNGANGYAYPYDLGGSNDMIETASLLSNIVPPKVYDSEKGCNGYFDYNGGGLVIDGVLDSPSYSEAYSVFVSGKTKNSLTNMVFTIGGKDSLATKGSVGLKDGRFYYRSIFEDRKEFVTPIAVDTKYKLATTYNGIASSLSMYKDGVTETTQDFSDDRPYLGGNDNVIGIGGDRSGSYSNSQFLLEDIILYKSDESLNMTTINNEQTNYFG